jgi:hypothetical protein
MLVIHVQVSAAVMLWCLTLWLHTWQQQMPLQRSMWASDYAIASL